MWIKSVLVLTLLVAGDLAHAQEVRIGVFGLFHPRQVTVEAPSGTAVVIRAGKESFVLESSSGQYVAGVRVSPDGLLLLRVGNKLVRASEIRVASRSDGIADFDLSVPGKISRRYRGTLVVTAASGTLVPVVVMDLETAVASVVQAESQPDTPLEALKAQAVATRSYFVAAKGRHHDFDFCDTTHCQFLREPPAPESPASQAAAATRSLVLAYRQQSFAAMFTRSCGGRTRTPADLEIPHQGYPYFSVRCDYCHRYPLRWRRQVSRADAGRLRDHGEAARLEIDRRRGWTAVPSDTFTVHTENQRVILEGVGEGHGIGLCQRGARALAEAGGSFQEILQHYYPNTEMVRFSDSTAPVEKRATYAPALAK